MSFSIKEICCLLVNEVDSHVRLQCRRKPDFATHLLAAPNDLLDAVLGMVHNLNSTVSRDDDSPVNYNGDFAVISV